jgi:hypothetical protein
MSKAPPATRLTGPKSLRRAGDSLRSRARLRSSRSSTPKGAKADAVGYGGPGIRTPKRLPAAVFKFPRAFCV